MKPSPMGEDEFRAIIDREVNDAVGWSDSELSSQRIEAMNYYQGAKFGDEREGRSQVVLTELADRIEFVMPSFMRVFASTDETWRFAPRSNEDAGAAEQATEYVNYVMNVDNDGFSVIHNAAKDGLLQKCGVAKVYWSDSEDVTEEEYDVTPEGLIFLMQDEELEVLSTEGEFMLDPTSGQPVDGAMRVRVKRTAKSGKCCVENVPPDEFLISKRATSIDHARMVAHRMTKTVSDLVAEGFDYEEVIEHLGSDDEQRDELDVRFRDVDDGDFRDAHDKSMQEITVTEAYLRADYDGDGIAELRRVYCIGSGYHILKNDPWDVKPFAMWSPIMMPHRAIGRAYADILKDIQKIKSTILRQILDSFYLVTNPRPVVTEAVNLDDVLSTAPGRPIRTRGDPATSVQWQKGMGLGGEGFPLLEYMDSIAEQRSGIGRTSMGLNPDILQNTTATAVAAQMSAAQAKVELMLRVFAETFMRPLAKLILRCVTKYQQKPRMIRLRNKFVEMDPRAWKNEYDIVINVGLGTGQVAERLAILGQIASKQELILKTLGLSNPLADVSQYSYTLRRMVETAGYRDSDRFFGEIQPGQQVQAPDAGQGEAQAKMAEAQGKLQIQQQATQGKLQLQAAEAEQRMQLKREENAADLAMDREKMMADFLLRRQEMDREFTLRMREMGLQAAVGMERNVSANLPRAS